jgi:hypothetical protein
MKVEGPFYSEYKKRGFTNLMIVSVDHKATTETEINLKKGQYLLINDKNNEQKMVKVLMEDGKTEGIILLLFFFLFLKSLCCHFLFCRLGSFRQTFAG